MVFRPGALSRRIGEFGMKSLSFVLVPLVLAAPALAQSPQLVSGLGSHWGYYRLITGGYSVMSGQGMVGSGNDDTTITITTRDGRALTEGDRGDATLIAASLCEATGRSFNMQTRGHWIRNGWLGFHGACTR